MLDTTRRAALASTLALGGVGLLTRNALASTTKPGAAAATIDAFAQEVMAAFPDQPGLGVAVVEDGQVTLAKGYGVRRMGHDEPVDESTLFGVASNTKAFTAAAMALLVEEGKVEWDAPVTRYLPNFAMSDPVVTKLMTVRDLLVHRSGLSLGAGDLMIWPSARHTRAEIVAGLRYLPISGGFRAGYAYDNVLYVAAGEVIAAVAGVPWERFVQDRLLTPLAMTDSTPIARAADQGRSAFPHARLGPPVRGMGPMKALAFDTTFDSAAAAGGINASPRDIAKWMRAQLALGALPGGGRLWSEASAREMWKPQTLTSASDGPAADNPVRPSLQAYALGWFVQDHRGERLLSHTGGLSGFISYTGLLPSRRSGLMIMTNAEENPVLRSLRYGGPDRLQGRRDFDWIASSRRVQATSEADTLRDVARMQAPASAKGAAPSLPDKAYAGVYRDPWYGTVTVSQAKDGLRISLDRTPLLRGALERFDGDTWRTRFDDPSQEDAFVTFDIENRAVKSATLRAVSPLADFSYDYQDLRLTREK